MAGNLCTKFSLRVFRLNRQAYLEEVRSALEPQLRDANEVWISAATREVQAVTRLDGRPVSTGKPGPHWRAVYEELQRYKRELAGTPW